MLLSCVENSYRFSAIGKEAFDLSRTSFTDSRPLMADSQIKIAASV